MAKHFSRRDFIHAGCTIAGATLAPHFAEAGRLFHGGTPPAAPSSLSLRNVININDFSFITNDYAMIDHIKPGTGVFPIPGYTSGKSWPQVLDATGWPNDAAASGQPFTIGFQIPDTANFAGPYILDWDGNGQLNLNFFFNTIGPLTVNSVTNCAQNGSTFSYISTGGASKAAVNFTFPASTPAGPFTGVVSVSTTGTSGFFVKNIRLYRAADATDLANGLIWRKPWKQSLVNLCPSALRFMNVLGGNNDLNCRFENRTLPNSATYYGTNETGAQFTQSPVYPFSSGLNQITVGTAVPTASNPKTTPASMVHGELATVPFTSGFDRCSGNNGGNPINNITNASSNPTVTCSTPIGLANLTWAAGTATGSIFENARFIAGDVVQLLIGGATQTGYNGTFTCTFTNATTFTYPLASNPGASPATGSPTYAGHGYNTGDIVSHFMNTVTQGGTMNGTAVITAILDTSQIHAGMTAIGPGVTPGTTVVSTTSSTVTLSAAVSLSATAVQTSYRVMNNLHTFPVKVTTVNATDYTITTTSGGVVNTSGIGSFFSGSGAFSYQFVTAQVGSGNDRTAYPIVFSDGSTPASWFGSYISAGQTKTLYFDKQITGQADGAGNAIFGAWMFTANPQAQFVGHAGDMPIEVCVALVNELNAMSPVHLIGMWMNLPLWGLCAIDPDYTTTSDWALNAVDVVMNPSSTNRVSGFSALGYSGASQINQPKLIVEYSNETWNSGNAKGWMSSRAAQRWPTNLGQREYYDLQCLRNTCVTRTVKNANPPGLSRITFMIGMWGTFGLPPTGGDGAGNYVKTFGGTNRAIPYQPGDWYTSDSTVISQSWGRPIDQNDGICPATYFDPPDSYYSTITGTGTFTDDSAMFNGTNNTSNGGGNYTGAANPTQAITNFVGQVTTTTSNSESITKYTTVLMPQFASTLASLTTGKVVLNYEGGTDWPAGANQGIPGGSLTVAQAAFTIAVIGSSQWATAQVNALNTINAISGCFMPSIYIWIGAQDGSGNKSQRFAYCAPDSYALNGGVPTEGQALLNSPVWVAMSARNVALPS